MTVPDWKALLIGGGVERIVFGGGALGAPGPVARACRVGEDEATPAARYALRLLGVRDIALGIATLASLRRPELARKLILVNLACQVGDGAALGQEVRERGRLDAQTAVGLAFGVAGTAVWIASLAQAPRPPRRARLGRRRKPKVDLIPDIGAASESAKKKLRAIA